MDVWEAIPSIERIADIDIEDDETASNIHGKLCMAHARTLLNIWASTYFLSSVSSVIAYKNLYLFHASDMN